MNLYDTPSPMPSFSSTVSSPREEFRADPYRLIQEGPKVGKNPGEREEDGIRWRENIENKQQSFPVLARHVLFFSSPFLQPFFPSLISSLLTSVTILFIGDASQVKVMGSYGNVTHASRIPDL